MEVQRGGHGGSGGWQPASACLAFAAAISLLCGWGSDAKLGPGLRVYINTIGVKLSAIPCYGSVQEKIILLSVLCNLSV